MRLFCSIIFLSVITTAFTQPFFPIKVQQKWGLMDKDGKLVVQPQYDAIGDFYKYGYAVVQQNGNVGVMNSTGQLIIPVRFQDLQILDSTIFAVVENKSWKIINEKGTVILDDNYEKVKIWQKSYIAFSKKGKWGIVHLSGKIISPPIYDNIQPYQTSFFLTETNDKNGLIRTNGKIVLSPVASEIVIHSDSLFLYKKDQSWGAVGHNGNGLLKNQWASFQKVGSHFLKLKLEGRNYLYAIHTQKIISKKKYDEFIPFSADKVLFRNQEKIGLMDENGFEILAGIYNEIQSYSDGFYRVKKGNYWGVIDDKSKIIIPFEYDYIAPLQTQVCVVRKGNSYGIANFKGELVEEVKYSRIELKNNIARAYINKKLTLLTFSQEGQKRASNQLGRHATIKIGSRTPTKKNFNRRRRTNSKEQDLVLDKFEWFYSAEEKKWGLRSLETGDIQIKPTFRGIEVKKDLGFTIVYIQRFHKTVIDRTTFRFENLYGMVNNEVGLLVTDLNIWDIRLEDFEEKSLSTARCIFNNGRHGIIRKDGKILKKDYAYIGEFIDGLARASARGQVSGKIGTKLHIGRVADYVENIRSPNEMVDYTIYDDEFLAEAMLTCADCDWGFIDTVGEVKVPEEYSFVHNFVNGIAIVQKEDKWGFINKDNRKLLDFKYDAIQFLDNTNERILRLYINHSKYGLIDTMGRAVISVIYDDVGELSEGLIPVEKNGLWGFVNEAGKLVIPCEYERAKGFHEGLAAVQKNRKWGFINPFNNIIIPFSYKDVGNFNGDLAWVKEKYNYGFINSKGEIMIEAQFEDARDFEEKTARVRVENDWGLINRSGIIVMKSKYNSISSFNKNGVAVVQLKSNLFSFINKAGERITTRRFEKIMPFSEGVAAVEHRDLWGFIDTSGQIVIEPKFEAAKSFQYGRASVKYKTKWGFINESGQWIIQPQFSKCLSFKDGKAVVYKGYRNAGLIDLNGNYIIEPSIHRMLDFNDGRGLVRDGNYRFYFITENNRLYKGYYQNAEAFQDGVAAVQQRGKWGLINDKGIELIPPKYDKVETFSDGFAKVRITQFSGIVLLDGTVVAEPNYEYISYAGNGIFRVEEGDKVGYLDNSGNWIWKLNR